MIAVHIYWFQLNRLYRLQCFIVQYRSILCRKRQAVPHRLSYNTFILDDSTKYNQWACTEISTHTFPRTESYTDTSRHGYQLIILLLHDSLKVLIRFFILSDCSCSSTLCPSHLSMSFFSAQCLCVQFSIKEGKSVWKRHTGSVQSQSLLKCCFQLYWYK